MFRLLLQNLLYFVPFGLELIGTEILLLHFYRRVDVAEGFEIRDAHVGMSVAALVGSFVSVEIHFL